MSHAHGRINGFQLDPTDFGHVLNAVKEWCDRNAVSLFLKYSPGASSDSWQVRLAPHTEMRGNDPCDVLLRARLAADRNIGEANASTEVAAIPIKNNPAILAHPWGNIRENGATALAFCQECLGWNNARLFNNCGYTYVTENVPEHLADSPIPPYSRHFHFNENHVDQVIDVVRKWGDVRATEFLLEYFPSAEFKLSGPFVLSKRTLSLGHQRNVG